MIGSLLMLGGSYNKSKNISRLFVLGWIVYMLIKADLTLGCMFPIVNIITFLLVSMGIRKISNRKTNTAMAILSIVIWSVAIDIICYYMFPIMSVGRNIFEYVLQGILFNAKFVICNIIAIGCCKLGYRFMGNIQKEKFLKAIENF